VNRYTGMLMKGGPQALALTKQLLTGTIPRNFPAMLEISAARFASKEGRDGIRAYADKRPPPWAHTS
jgi:methylglutaconyl-CoA hydratase